MLRRFTLLIGLILYLSAAWPVHAKPSAALDCTFKAKYPVVILRSGPGTNYDRVGFLRSGDSLKVIDQQAGKDGFVWWKGEKNVWVRSDLGTSDCPATCGNTVCEYGETSSTCAQDCQGGTTTSGTNTSNLTSTGKNCLVQDTQACYKSISGYPTLTNCRSWLNENGCVTCSCAGGATSNTSTTAASSTATGCTYSSCEACYAAFPCYPNACTKKTCTLNEFGCPSCQTAP